MFAVLLSPSLVLRPTLRLALVSADTWNELNPDCLGRIFQKNAGGEFQDIYPRLSEKAYRRRIAAKVVAKGGAVR